MNFHNENTFKKATPPCIVCMLLQWSHTVNAYWVAWCKTK